MDLVETPNIWKNIKFSGEPPCPRWGHTTTLIEEKNELFVFGGYEGVNMLQDSFYFDLEKFVWKKVEMKGDLPSSRAGHSCTLFNKSKIMLFGGGDGNV